MSIVTSSYIERLDPKNKKSFHFKTCAGSHFKPVYEYQIIDGIKQLVSCGETDIYAEIQSYAASTDINNIIARFVNGEVDILNQVNGVYGDFSDIPDNYAEIFNRVQKCENFFNSLPADLRDKFDNSYQKFWADFGSDSFNDIINNFSNVVDDNMNSDKEKVEVPDAE